MTAEWVATYRLQLHAGFPLKAAQQILPYLADLGVSHVYLSPCLQAHPGSQHGYDVTDPTRISDDLGGEAAWADFCGAGARLALAPAARHRAESHVGVRTQSLVGRCSGTRAIQQIHPVLRFQKSAG